jgi:hypothetical protein
MQYHLQTSINGEIERVDMYVNSVYCCTKDIFPFTSDEQTIFLFPQIQHCTLDMLYICLLAFKTQDLGHFIQTPPII